MDIFLVTEKDAGGPQELAMLQALYSRSIESVQVHLEKVRKSGSAKFMENYYVGYGHQSIADCGNIAFFIENVSMLAAKALQDSSLYNGQETSTRYIDFSTREFIDPIENVELTQCLESLRNFYTNSMPIVIEHNKQRFPQTDGVSDTQYLNAIKAKSFDILRGFLPCGASTQLSLYGSIRHINDRVHLLMQHPLEEVRLIALEIYKMIDANFPASAKKFEYSGFLAENAEAYHYLFPAYQFSELTITVEPSALVTTQMLWENILNNRPKKFPLPRQVGMNCVYNIHGLIDFGSFRDLQRHRNGLCPIPMVEGQFGFEQWYTDNLPEQLREEAGNLLSDIGVLLYYNMRDQYRPVDLQYYWPMGTRVPFALRYDLPQMVYVVELRTPKTVHSTMRRLALRMHDALRADFPEMALYADTDPSEWDVRRGSQTITEKQ